MFEVLKRCCLKCVSAVVLENISVYGTVIFRLAILREICFNDVGGVVKEIVCVSEKWKVHF